MSIAATSTSARLPSFLAFTVTAILLLVSGGQAQTYRILHFFTGHEDGSLPTDSPTLDAAGNLYGTSHGYFACDNVFKLSPQPGGTWTEAVLTTFCGGDAPYGNVIFDKAGSLYGTTSGGGALGNGAVFKLSPNPDGTWTRTTLHDFAGFPTDGAYSLSGVVFDAAGNLYGATCNGGTSNNGTVYQLKLDGNGSWTEKVLHSFQGGTDGNCPIGSPTFDGAENNLYGATSSGGITSQCSGCGTVFQLKRNQDWKENVLHTFTGGADGREPLDGVIWARPNTLYGTTFAGAADDLGIVYQVELANGTWTESVIHSFTLANRAGAFPQSRLVLDGHNLYGTTSAGGMGNDPDASGTVFELVFSNGLWSEQLLHSFQGPPHDGWSPQAGVTLRRDANRVHIFGMTWRGGPEQCVLGCGVVYEITQRSQRTR
jgi:uncharacterized repeat protein (TIGR03803 family)